MNSGNKIRKQFQSKFDDFNLPPPVDGWERIEKSLDAGIHVAGRTVRRRLAYAGSAAVAAVLLIFGILLFLNNPSGEEQPVVSLTTPYILDKTTRPESKLDTPLPTDPVQSPLVNNFAASPVRKQVVSPIQPMDPLAVYEAWMQEEALAHTLMASKMEPLEENNEPTGDESINYDIMMEELISVSGMQDELFAENTFSHMDERLSISLGGKGGLTSFHQTVNSPMTLRSSAVVNETQLSDELSKMVSHVNSSDNVAEMEHDQPVSFGVTVSKALFENLYIETGLFYTYLYSRSKNTNTNFQNYQTQRLHYLGVPLNVNYNLFSFRDLNVYFSVGGMIEKDIYGRLREEREGQSMEADNKAGELKDESISLHNPQLSVNTGIGLSYPLYRDLRLYGKIGGAYYFDAKNEYKTIYSDRKIVMDLSLGIRYEF